MWVVTILVSNCMIVPRDNFTHQKLLKLQDITDYIQHSHLEAFNYNQSEVYG